MTTSKRAADNAKECVKKNYRNDDYFIETLVRMGKITPKEGDAFYGIRTEGMSDEKRAITLWTKSARMLRLWIYPRVEDLADPKVASLSSINSFESGRPLRFDGVITIMLRMYSVKDCESQMFCLMEMYFYAIMANCNIDVTMMQQGTNLPASNPITILRVNSKKNGTSVEESPFVERRTPGTKPQL